MDGSVFLNGRRLNIYGFYFSKSIDIRFSPDDRTRAAIHAPTSKDWVETFDFVFGDLEEDPSENLMIFVCVASLLIIIINSHFRSRVSSSRSRLH